MKHARTCGALIATALLLTGSTTGCVWMAAGATTGLSVAHAKGNLELLIEHPADEVTEAAELAVDDLGLHRISTVSWGDSTEVRGRTGYDKKFSIRVRDLGEDLTKLSIRVGSFGNQSVTQRIYDGIRVRLEGTRIVAATITANRPSNTGQITASPMRS